MVTILLQAADGKIILQQIDQMIADIDKDGSGAIDFDEFLHMMTAKIGERDTREELTKAFRIIDEDKNVNFKFLLLYIVSLVERPPILFQ